MMEVAMLALLGLLSIYFEFFLPGGIVGGLGIVLLCIAAISSFFAAGWHIAFLFILAEIALLLLVVKLALFMVKKKESTISLNQDQSGFRAPSCDVNLYLGKRGKTVSDCRPAGYIAVENRRLAATAKLGFLKKQTAIIVTGSRGGQLVIERDSAMPLKSK